MQNGRAVLKDAALSSDWSCKAISTPSVLDVTRMDKWTHHCDTLAHVIWPYPLTLCSRLSLSITPVFFTFLPHSHILCKLSGAEKALSFNYWALKHTGHWDRTVTLYIVTRQRQRIGKRTMKHLQADLERRSWRELNNNLDHQVFPRKETSQPQKVKSTRPRMICRLLKEWRRIQIHTNILREGRVHPDVLSSSQGNFSARSTWFKTWLCHMGQASPSLWPTSFWH